MIQTGYITARNEYEHAELLSQLIKLLDCLFYSISNTGTQISFFVICSYNHVLFIPC